MNFPIIDETFNFSDSGPVGWTTRTFRKMDNAIFLAHLEEARRRAVLQALCGRTTGDNDWGSVFKWLETVAMSVL